MGRDYENENQSREPSLAEVLRDNLKGTPLEGTVRVQILVNGREIMGTTTTHNPKNSDELLAMLKDFVAFMEAPRMLISDPEVLGDRSP